MRFFLRPGKCVICGRCRNSYYKSRIVAHINRKQELSLTFDWISHPLVWNLTHPRNGSYKIVHFDSYNTMILYFTLDAKSTTDFFNRIKSRFKYKNDYSRLLNNLEKFCNEMKIKVEIM